MSKEKHRFLEGGGEMGEMIRGHDWSKTSIGMPDVWPTNLRTMTSVMLANPFGMYIAWGKDYVQLYNDGYRPILGSTKHPLALGISTRETFKEIWHIIGPMFDDVMQGKAVGFPNFHLPLNRNGFIEDCYFDFSYSPIRNDSGEVGGVLVVVVEITQRLVAEQKQNQAEKALREREEHLRALVTATSDVIYVMSHDWSEMGILDGRIFVPNTGKPLGNWEWFKANIPVSEQARVRNIIEEAIRNKSMFQLEHGVIRADGTEGWTMSRAIPILNSDGQIEKWFGAATDVTDRQKAEEALKESEERFRSLADQSPMIVFIIEPDEEATISYWSKTWLMYTGQTLEQALGRAWDGIVHPDDVQTVLDIYVPAFQKRIPYTIPAIRLKRNDGQYRWHYFKASPRYLPNGDFMGFVGVGIDIQDQQMAFEELETKNSMLIRINNDLDNFIYTVSHDLKAPISNIEGLVNSLKDAIEFNNNQVEEQKEIIKLIDKSILRFKNTIIDLTDISKAQKNINGDPEVINLDEIIKDVLDTVSDLIKENDAKIKVNIENLKTIRFSKINMKSILYNLISNGIKYRAPDRKPEIEILTSINDGLAVIEIKDNGLGIKEVNKPKLFSMFKRFHDHVEGSGIGLYIVKRIVENAGGKIEVMSEENKGSNFMIYLNIF